MTRTTAGMMAITGIVALLGGCAFPSTTPEVDARFGESLNIMKAQQTINPDASRNTDPVAGVDGKAAKGAYDNYRDSFRKPPAEGLNVTPIGNVSGAMSGAGSAGSQ